MALQKTIPTAYGVDLTYWKVTRLNIDWLNQIGEVFLGGSSFFAFFPLVGWRIGNVRGWW